MVGKELKLFNDNKMRLTDVADTKQILRLIQSVLQKAFKGELVEIRA